jgi:hypothetical protein
MGLPSILLTLYLPPTHVNLQIWKMKLERKQEGGKGNLNTQFMTVINPK